VIMLPRPFWGSRLKHLRSAKHRALIVSIVQVRKTAGLTQRQLAARPKRSNSFVWKIEAAERRVELLEFIEIARCLDQDPSQMFSRLLRG
jgi:predicted transcriptional regulator